MKRLILIGCGKAKRSVRCAARDMYVGNLFAARLRYAELTGDPWQIVSAEFGLLNPNTEIHPYDKTISDLCEVDRAAWALGVVVELLNQLADSQRLSKLYVELHMGEDYAEPLRKVLTAVGIQNGWPVKGKAIGQQLSDYKHYGEMISTFNAIPAGVVSLGGVA